jgi:hypothetical protein
MNEVSQNDYEEPAEAALRTQLGLRPTHYSTTSDAMKGNHPDTGPCPAWCFVADPSVEWGHEIDRDHPTVATHSYDVTASIVASLYPGAFERHPAEKPGDVEYVIASTIEARLPQVGQQDPEIRVALRHQDRPVSKAFVELVRLSVTDARELAAILTHLVQLADGEAR